MTNTSKVNKNNELQKLDAIYEKTKRDYYISIEAIQLYCKKISQVFLMTTTITGMVSLIITIIFSFITKINIGYEKMNTFLFMIWLYLLSVIFMYLLFSIYNCIYGLIKQRYSLSRPSAFYKKFGFYNNINLKRQLIVQTSYNFDRNVEHLKTLKSHYILGLNNLRKAIIVLAIFIIFSLIFYMSNFYIGV
jgi:hypothetical protein